MRNIAFGMKAMLTRVNLFQNKCSKSQLVNAQEIGIVASRIYLAALIASVFGFLLLYGLTETTNTVTIQSPTIDTFEQLEKNYPAKLTCPCSQIAIPHSTFLSISPTFHQVS